MRHNRFCLVFSKKFNIVSTLFANQSPTLPQKSDSRGGLFWCKKELAHECGKMNIYYTEPPFAAFFRPFAAKCSAICGKMQCILMLNAVRFAAKRKVKWC